MSKKECVYVIFNNKNNRFYIGTTKDFNRRKKQHLVELRNDSHNSRLMQQDFNKFGQDSFIFSILLEDTNSYVLEKHFINILKPQYNKTIKVLIKEDPINDIKNDIIEIKTLLSKVSLQKIDTSASYQVDEKKILIDTILDKYGTLTNFSKISKISQPSLSRMFNSNKNVKIRSSTINKIKNYLNI